VFDLGGVCGSRRCDRVVVEGAQWCCGSCQLADSVGYQVPDTPSLGHTEKCELRQAAVVTHRCPPVGSGAMPCCGRTPLEVSRWDRLSEDPGLVTCRLTA
jgi:hypothetical protein